MHQHGLGGSPRPRRRPQQRALPPIRPFRQRCYSKIGTALKPTESADPISAP
jgi:hypothetical protein